MNPDDTPHAADLDDADGEALVLEPVDARDFDALLRDHMQPVTDAVPTPLPGWNRSCRDEGGGLGLAPGWFTIIAGKPGSGKSILAINTAVSALRAGRNVCFLSYEMSRHQLLTRALAIASGCDVERLERGGLFREDTYREAVQCFRALQGGLFLLDRPDRSIGGMIRILRRAVDEGCVLLIVDYAQLVGRRETPGIYERTQLVSGALQGVAFESRATVLALSQFNRGSLVERATEPGPEGLKGGSLDEDADQVVMLDYSKYERTMTGAVTNVVVGKNRHGPTPRIPVVWDYRSLRITEQVTAATEPAPSRLPLGAQPKRGGMYA